MSTNLNPIQVGITTLTIDGITITRDIAKQLDELRFEDWENFEPIGRVRTGISYFDEGIELLGRHKETGALVRMYHIEETRRVLHTHADGRISYEKPAPETPQDHLRETLAQEYGKLPLLVLPKAGLP